MIKATNKAENGPTQFNRKIEVNPLPENLGSGWISKSTLILSFSIKFNYWIKNFPKIEKLKKDTDCMTSETL